jgi:hypothetical protein
VKTQDAALLPKMRKLWFKVEPSAAAKKLRRAAGKLATKDYELSFREVLQINSALSDQTDVASAHVLICNTEPQRVFQGVTPGHAAFVLDDEERRALVTRDNRNAQIIHPYLIGDEILAGQGQPERFVLDFEQRNILDAQQYAAAFAYVQSTVLPDRQKAAEEGRDYQGKMRPHHGQFLDRWWKLSWDRAEMIADIARVPRYLVCSRVTKRPIFVFVSATVRPGDALQVFIFPDDYSFGILQSAAHWLWFVTKCSKLTERFRYTPESVFDTFPWPQTQSAAQVEAVATAGREVRRIREESLPKLKGGLRALYRTLEVPGANPLKDGHTALDAAVLAAYGFPPKADLLAQLLALNQQVASRIEKGEPVTAPGVPAGFPDPARLITGDCIRPMQ